MAGGGGGALINGYVGRGLLHYYDGIDNRGIGESHAATGLPWVDLAGERDVLISDRRQPAGWLVTQFESNAWRATNGGNSAFTVADVPVPYPEFTLDCRAFVTTEADGPIFGFYTANGNGAQKTLAVLEQTTSSIGVIFKGANWTGFVKYHEPFPNAPVTLSLTYKANDDYMKLYADGQLFSEFAPLPDKTVFNDRFNYSDTRMEIGTTAPSNGLSMANDGLIYRAMVYDRVLSPSEIAANYQNDLVRFTA